MGYSLKSWAALGGAIPESHRLFEFSSPDSMRLKQDVRDTGKAMLIQDHNSLCKNVTEAFCYADSWLLLFLYTYLGSIKKISVFTDRICMNICSGFSRTALIENIPSQYALNTVELKERTEWKEGSLN